MHKQITLALALLVALLASGPVRTSAQTFGGTPGPVLFNNADQTLTDDQRAAIREAHDQAYQQVLTALQYLQVNSRRIMAGEDDFYNQILGRFYDRTESNPLLGQYTIDNLGAIPDERNSLGEGTVRTDDNVVTFNDDLIFRNQIAPGQLILIGTEMHRIVDITIEFMEVDIEDLNGRRVNNEDNGSSTTEQISVPMITEIILENDVIDESGSIEIFPVKELAGTPNRMHYDQVVSTFEAIRDLMQERTVFVADRDIVTDAILDTLSNNNNRFDIDGFVADQRFRQFGFSNSDSEQHLDQIMNDPDDLLEWVEDIVRANNGDLSDITFLTDALTAFADVDSNLGLNTVYLGDGFLNERITGLGGLFDGSVNTDTAATELSQAQMIVAAFAEFATDLAETGNNPINLVEFNPDTQVAGFGILEIFEEFGNPNGNANVPFPQSFDAESLAQFLDLFSTIDGLGNTGLAAPGKEAVALPLDFVPIIPDLINVTDLSFPVIVNQTPSIPTPPNFDLFTTETN